MCIIQTLELSSQASKKCKWIVEYCVHYIKEKKTLFLSDFKQDTLHNDDGSYFTISNYTCKGNALIVQYDSKNKKRAEFRFRDGIKKLSRYSYTFDPITFDEFVNVEYYFSAIPHGDWIYYKENGEIEKKNNRLWLDKK